MKERHSKKTLLIGVILLLAAGVWIIFKLVIPDNKGIAGGTNEERIAFIESCGWETGITHSDLCEVRIPINFDEAYSEYNDIQRKQGFDLRKYRACTVKKYTFPIKNAGNDNTELFANLLVYEGMIIGADISSAEAGGIVTVLLKK